MSITSKYLVNVPDYRRSRFELVLNHRSRLSKQEVELPYTCSAVKHDAM